MRKTPEGCRHEAQQTDLIVIAALLIGVLIGYLAVIWHSPFPLNLTGAAVILALIGVAVFVLRERIQEIRSGEEDDLGKY